VARHAAADGRAASPAAGSAGRLKAPIPPVPARPGFPVAPVRRQENAMARFITIGYGDENGYQRTAPSVRDAAHAHDARLKAQGALIGVAGAPVQVRNPDAAGVRATAGAFLRSDLPVAGFAVIEAIDLDAAIAMVSRTPCAVAGGVVEVWPLGEMP
jgi:hypothetical protein